MMPIVELAYNTVARASGLRNGGATMAKKMKIATAPTSAPISGRISKRCSLFCSLTRSSWTTLWVPRSRSAWVVMSVLLFAPEG